MELAVTSHVCKELRAGPRSLKPKLNRQAQGSNIGQKCKKNVIVLPWRRERNRMKPNLVVFDSMSGSLDRAVALEIRGKLRHMF